MSTLYSLRVQVEAVFNCKTVERILQRGIDHGMIYFKGEYVSAETLSAIQGATKLLFCDEQIREDGGPYIFIKFQDTYFSLWINAHEGGGTIIYLGGSGAYSWKKAFVNSDDSYYFDFMRYVRLLLVMCEDFSIISLEAITD
jgi:hypothetical protein